MFNKYSNLLACYRGEFDNYWSDVGVIDAITVLNAFSLDDWGQLLSALPKESRDWLDACAQTMSDADDAAKALEVLMVLIETHDLRVKVSSLDSINQVLSKFQSLTKYQKSKIASVTELMTDVSQVEKIVLGSIKSNLATLSETDFFINKISLRSTALQYKQALIDWKTRWWELPTFVALNKPWTEQDKIEGNTYHARLVDPVLTTLDRILELCVTEQLEQPFDLGAFVMGTLGRILRDELDFPEISKPYDRLIELLRGGMSSKEFWETPYYKEQLMPPNYDKTKSS